MVSELDRYASIGSGCDVANAILNIRHYIPLSFNCRKPCTAFTRPNGQRRLTLGFVQRLACMLLKNVPQAFLDVGVSPGDSFPDAWGRYMARRRRRSSVPD